jgi:hypothetical protein
MPQSSWFSNYSGEEVPDATARKPDFECRKFPSATPDINLASGSSIHFIVPSEPD